MAGIIQVTVATGATAETFDSSNEVFSGVPNVCVDTAHQMVTEFMQESAPGFVLKREGITGTQMIESGGGNRLRVYQHKVGFTVNLKGEVIDNVQKCVHKMSTMSGDLVAFADDKWQDLVHFVIVDREHMTVQHNQVTIRCESK